MSSSSVSVVFRRRTLRRLAAAQHFDTLFQETADGAGGTAHQPLNEDQQQARAFVARPHRLVVAVDDVLGDLLVELLLQGVARLKGNRDQSGRARREERLAVGIRGAALFGADDDGLHQSLG